MVFCSSGGWCSHVLNLVMSIKLSDVEQRSRESRKCVVIVKNRVELYWTGDVLWRAGVDLDSARRIDDYLRGDSMVFYSRGGRETKSKATRENLEKQTHRYCCPPLIRNSHQSYQRGNRRTTLLRHDHRSSPS